MRKLLRFAVAVIVLAVVPVSAAHAYIDPNTGGLLFQILAPVVAIATSLWLLAKEKLVAVFSRVFRLIVGRHR